MISHPSGTRIGGVAPPLLAGSHGCCGWGWPPGRGGSSRVRARTSRSPTSAATYETQILWRGSVTPAGSGKPTSGLFGLRFHIGRCSMAYAGRPSGPGTGSGKNTPVFVGVKVHVRFQGRLIGERHRTKPLPMHQVAAERQGDSGAERTVRRVSHHVRAQASNQGNTRVFNAGRDGVLFPGLVRPQDDAEPLNANGLSALVESDARTPNA